ncbi:PIN-like domain-containing protein [Bacillus inaquosorum]|uniref:PIN-like domain-containing protein n=1 Tax=Bacillus inaquosorum TaxID=483913 RepID=UPI00228146BA|nr:PIN-like domain-containing protein [Bacillus inaquosorum]MCY8083262.1 PIN-like domain-containing protein [Bacillus inaquosorum]MCY8702011.1 PIN-like domain-containing protein [Bacillus inaquosorum]
MEEWKKYLHQPNSVSELLNDSIIVIDTNVLLAAYQWREVTVNEVLNALQKIKDENRLRIPLQVIKEFSRNRPHEIQQRMNDLDTLISKMQKEKPFLERVPMLEGKDSLKEIEELRENYNKAVKDYRDGLIKLRDHLKELFYNDHFLDKIMELAEGTILLPEKGDHDLEKEAKERFKLKIPPGFKDSSKEENSAGDFIVWSSILQLKSNVVFVSGDKKPDWVYQDSKKNPITARRELVEEFFIKTGRDFAHITPKDFITSLNPAVSEHVKEDLVNYKTINQQNLSRKDNENMNKNSFPNLKAVCKRIIFLVEELCITNDITLGGSVYDDLAALVEKHIIAGRIRTEIEFVLKINKDLDFTILNDLQVNFATSLGEKCIETLTEYLYI